MDSEDVIIMGDNDNSQETETDENTDTDPSNTNSLQKIESIVLSFLTQLVDASTNIDTGIDSDSDLDLDLDLESNNFNTNFNFNSNSNVNYKNKRRSGTGTSNTRNPKQNQQQNQQRKRKRKHKPRIEIQLVDRTKEPFPVVDEDYDGDGDSIPQPQRLRLRPRMKKLVYPRKSSGSSCRSLATLLRTLDLMHEAVLDGVPMTKRDLFYKDVKLFKNQRTVDTLVDDIAATLELDRADLNIRASSKGLLCGSGLVINLLSGEMIQGTDTEGMLIPVGEDIESFGLDDDVCWVLIVEKEAVFQSLCRLRITDREDMPGRGLVITGKGYPDVATRHLVKTLTDCLPERIPIMALVDADPYGLDILSVYKYGSRAMFSENEKLAAGERVRWIGIWNSEFGSLGIDKDKLLQIGKADGKKAFAMLKRPLEKLPKKWKKELVHMLFTRRKAEIEILSTLNLTMTTTTTTICEEIDEDRVDNVSLSMDNGYSVFKHSCSRSETLSSSVLEDENENEKKRLQPIPQRNGTGNGAGTGNMNGLVWYLQKKIGRLVEKYSELN